MSSGEDVRIDRPMDRDYDARVNNEVFIPDTEIPGGETDPYDVDDTKDKNGSKENMMDRNMTNEVGSTGAYDELTATLDASAWKRKGLFRNHKQKAGNGNMEDMPWFHDEAEERELRMRQGYDELNGRETRRVIYSSLLAALMIAGVFISALFLFLLFCTKVWF